MTSERYLGIYLNDHLAGAIAGHELAKRAAGNNEGTPTGTFLTRLADEIEADRNTLERIMDQLEIKKDLLKDAAAWLAEKVGRLKLNGKLVGYSDLSRLVELEGLSLGVEGKIALWRSLRQVADRYPTLSDVNLEELQRRAESQREELERFRLEAAQTAL
ncbi:MAG TPA: hypothetical protein VHJ82_07265 [Actinomycetota bacterium]|nr:hypothetical protein [Actinomycetota bacterium]